MRLLLSVLLSFLFFVTFLIFLVVTFGNFKESDPKLKDAKIEILTPGNLDLLPAELRYLIPPLEKSRITRFYDTELIFNSLVEIDEWGKRKIPHLYSETALEHLIVAGCSNTFGSGLNVEDTFVYILETKLPQVNTYNFSMVGGGLGTALNYVQKMDVSKFVKEEKGKFFYMFFDDHISRWLGRLPYLSWAPPNFPHYEVEDEKVVFKGSVGELSSYKFVQFAKSFGLMKALMHGYHSFSIFYAFTPEEMRSFVLGIEELERTYKSKYPAGEFYVVLYQFGTHPEVLKMLTQLLDEKGIKYVDPSPAFDSHAKSLGLNLWDFHIPYDFHPNAEANKFLADYLLERIFK
jgi:hypothetical protein